VARIRDIVIDALDPPGLAAFWAAALDGYAVRPYDDAEIAQLASVERTPASDPAVALDGPGPTIFLQETSEPKASRNRLHLDLVAGPRSEEVKRLCDVGATIRDEYESYSVLLDPEGNEFCVRDPD
jgi:hypothetical protein